MKISLSAGHAKTTAGKQTPDGMKEWEFNAAVVKYIIDGLENYENVQVLRVDDPTGKRDIPLKERTNIINRWKSDVHIDIHANAAGPGSWYDDAKGIETFVYTSKPKEALALAQKVQNNLVSATKLQNRGVKAADFHMLRESNMTAILVEAGFMTNKSEALLLKSDNYRRVVAGAIVAGLVSQYGLKQKARVATMEKEDLTKAWGADSIQKVIDQGIIPGYSDGTWRPNEPIKRAELAVILDRIGLLNKK